ncbi:unnamed protein product [Paramecium sonneborni]|uniref:VWFA domain-containing protein n=1 Tax=Paramecium sonneborni TaxID=65129 RepID=A0A8S1QSM8_9CILI|nr:unnamed protein product [Paramecium sonneborni]
MGNKPSSSKSSAQKQSKQNIQSQNQGGQQSQQSNKQQLTPQLHLKLTQQIPVSQNSQNINEEAAQQLEEEIAEQQIIEQTQNEHIDIDAKVGETIERIHINMIARQDVVTISQFPQILPVVLQVQAIKSQQKHAKANIDLICVVDVSGSMEGQKINLVKDSLRYIQKILSPNDRISLVTFGTYSAINLPWTRNKPENKQKIKDAIVGMKIRDSTNIAEGVKQGLRMIKQRKYKNPVTCMFVLTDGQDDNKGADDRCQQAINEYQIQDTFVINSFGYGQDHDAKVMNNISNLKGGTFTFIDNINKASEHFILAMSGMLSVLAKNVKFIIEENPKYPIKKLYGDDFLWKKIQESKYQMNLNYLLEGENKEFALEIEIPSSNKINSQNEKVLRTHLIGEFIELKTNFTKQQELNIQFSQQDIPYVPKEIVEVNYLRAKAGNIIGIAKELAKTKKYDQAQQSLNKMIDEIEQSHFIASKALEVVITDLNQIKEICKPQLFEQKGEALMLNKQKNHIQRQQSLNNSMEWNSDQEEQLDNLKKGNLQLSICDMDDDYQNGAQLDSPIQQFRQNSFNSDISN